jgi:hypothetical protein
MQKKKKSLKETTGNVPLKVTAVYQVLPYLKKFYAIHKFTPSYKIIGDHFGKTKHWAYLAVKELVKLKIIKIEPPNKWHNIKFKKS